MDEYDRFKRSVAVSDLACWCVAHHLRMKGNEVMLILRPTRTRTEPMGKYGGKTDLLIDRPNRKPFEVEVKWKHSVNFTSLDQYPYATVFLDRINKPPADLTVVVNRDLTHGIFIPLSTKPQWVEQQVMDKTKGYPWKGFACPKLVLSFRELILCR